MRDTYAERGIYEACETLLFVDALQSSHIGLVEFYNFQILLDTARSDRLREDYMALVHWIELVKQDTGCQLNSHLGS